jgi:hypothetical protein
MNLNTFDLPEHRRIHLQINSVIFHIVIVTNIEGSNLRYRNVSIIEELKRSEVRQSHVRYTISTTI